MAQGRYVLTSAGAFHLEHAAITCILKHNYGSLEPLLTSRLMIYFDCVSLSGRRAAWRAGRPVGCGGDPRPDASEPHASRPGPPGPPPALIKGCVNLAPRLIEIMFWAVRAALEVAPAASAGVPGNSIGILY